MKVLDFRIGLHDSLRPWDRKIVHFSFFILHNNNNEDWVKTDFEGCAHLKRRSTKSTSSVKCSYSTLHR